MTITEKKELKRKMYYHHISINIYCIDEDKMKRLGFTWSFILTDRYDDGRLWFKIDGQEFKFKGKVLKVKTLEDAVELHWRSYQRRLKNNLTTK